MSKLSAATPFESVVSRVRLTVPVQVMEESEFAEVFSTLALAGLSAGGFELLSEVLHHTDELLKTRDAQRPMPVWQDEVNGQLRVAQNVAPMANVGPTPMMDVDILVPERIRRDLLDPALVVHQPVLAAAFQAEAPLSLADRIAARRETKALGHSTSSAPAPITPVTSVLSVLTAASSSERPGTRVANGRRASAAR